MSLSKREKELLWTVKDLDEYVIDSYSDDEILENMNMFLRLEGFRNSDRAVKLLLELDLEKLKQLETLYSIPKQLKFKDAMALMDKGLKLYKSDITRKYVYELLGNRENLVKYKHLIDFNLVVREKLDYACNRKTALDNLVEVCYDEIKDITTRTLLDALGVNIGYECNNLYMGILLDKIASLGNRQFKDKEIINVLLDAVTGLKYTNPDFYNDIFKYFDDDYIINNIEHFSPIQLDCADRLTEIILQVVINNSKVWKRYEFGLSDIKTDLSIDFLFYNCEKINNKMILWKQKNIVKAYKQHCNASIFTDRIDLLRVYLYNARLDEDDLAFLKANIKKSDITEIITHYAKTDECMSELALHRLVELEGFKNGEN
jgi:hypothetical protein